MIPEHEGPPDVSSVCAVFRKPGFLAEMCWERRTWPGLVARTGQRQDSAPRNLQTPSQLPPDSGEFCCEFPALIAVCSGHTVIAAGVARPGPVRVLVTWGTSLQGTLCLAALVATFQASMASRCCLVSTDKGYRLGQLLHKRSESGAQHRQGRTQ